LASFTGKNPTINLRTGPCSFLNGSGSNVQRFRSGLVFNANRRLNHSTLGSRAIKKRTKTFFAVLALLLEAPDDTRENTSIACGVVRSGFRVYRGTSLIRNCFLLGPYCRTMPRAIVLLSLRMTRAKRRLSPGVSVSGVGVWRLLEYLANKKQAPRGCLQ
jgi:hypothetical protein